MFIPFLPAFSSWEDWNGQVIHYFGEQQFPVVLEENWQELARAISVSPLFDEYGVPRPETFERWQDWATALTSLINGNGQ